MNAQLQRPPAGPAAPEALAGLAGRYLSFRLIPVVDLRHRFGLGAVEEGNRTCIVVVETEATEPLSRQTGLIVDGVEDVVEVAAAELSAPSDLGGHTDTSYLLALARVKNEVKMLLDIGRVLAAAGRSLVAA
jgi:purine-binding chemotaxis protein CheW